RDGTGRLVALGQTTLLYAGGAADLGAGFGVSPYGNGGSCYDRRCEAQAMNAAGQVAGWADVYGAPTTPYDEGYLGQHAFLYDPATGRALDLSATLSQTFGADYNGKTYSAVYAINAGGQVAGY